jgi:DNA-binding transcriptional ArsR family regulator
MRLHDVGYDLTMVDSDDFAPQTPQGEDSSEVPLETLEAIRKHAREASNLLKALAHEPRLMLLCLLAKGERSVTELETILSMRQPAVSQQLARLRMGGIVAPRREGKAIYYRLANDDVRRIMTVLNDIFRNGK